MMKFTGTINKNYEFRRLYSKGKSAAAPCLVVYARKSKKDTNRIGITVSTKVGKAVVRNRVRRRIREIYRLNEDKLQRGTTMVIVARVRAAEASYRQIEESFFRCCAKLELLEKGAGEP
jgi:ribonuclease P protein component